MNCYIILFCKTQIQSQEHPLTPIRFGLAPQAPQGLGILQTSKLSFAADDFAKQYDVIRQPSFDWASSTILRQCFLFESKMPLASCMEKSLVWQTFPQAARQLTAGREKNILQLCVQYLSTGGVDQSVVAADYDAAFLKDLEARLLKDK